MYKDILLLVLAAIILIWPVTQRKVFQARVDKLHNNMNRLILERDTIQTTLKGQLKALGIQCKQQNETIARMHQGRTDAHATSAALRRELWELRQDTMSLEEAQVGFTTENILPRDSLLRGCNGASTELSRQEIAKKAIADNEALDGGHFVRNDHRGPDWNPRILENENERK